MAAKDKARPKMLLLCCVPEVKLTSHSFLQQLLDSFSVVPDGTAEAVLRRQLPAAIAWQGASAARLKLGSDPGVPKHGGEGHFGRL